MFKYTAPWQVLCHSLDHDNKRLSAAEPQDDLTSFQTSSSVHSPAPDPSSLAPSPSPRPASDLRSRVSFSPGPLSVMDSTPRRWVLKPLSPSLQPSDLRSIAVQRDEPLFFPESISVGGSQASVYVGGQSESSPDVVVEARQVSVSQDGGSTSDELPNSPCSSVASSHSGFYSFVEDPFSHEAEQNEAWMVSPQRQTQLATLKEENIFKLQTYSSHRKPESLFQDGNGDSRYKIDQKNGFDVVGKEEERQLRKEIIRSQAPKKSAFDASFDVDSSENTSKLIEGFSISYSPVIVKSKPPITLESGAIVEDQINFSAAREQFVNLEKNKINPIIRPRKMHNVSVKSNKDASMQEKEGNNEEMVFKPSVFEAEVKENHSRQSSLFEESGSEEFSLDVGAGYESSDGLASDKIQQEQEANRFSFESETPIEREIRLTQEREENLRRSRGLQNSVSRGEMVEIKTKRPPLTPARGKDRGRVSFIFQETEEQGYIRENKEKTEIKRAFETQKEYESIGETSWMNVIDNGRQQQESSLGFKPSGTKQVQGYMEQYLSSARQDQPTVLQEQGDTRQNEQEFTEKDGLEGYKNIAEMWQSRSQSEQEKKQDEANNVQSKNEQERRRFEVENEYKSMAERSRLDSFSDEVFPLPCCPHKHPEESSPSHSHSSNTSRSETGPSISSPQTLRDSSRSWRDSLEPTGLQTRGGPGAPDFIEKEIEEALRREQELKEQREARKSQVFSPQPLVEQANRAAVVQFYPQTKTDKPEPRLSSSTRPVARLSSVSFLSPQPWSSSSSSSVPQPSSPAPVRTGPLPVRGLTETLLQDFEERRNKVKLEENAYAGIQPVDAVNNEVVESTRVTRHKNKRALRWEAGVFANEQDQQ